MNKKYIAAGILAVSGLTVGVQAASAGGQTAPVPDGKAAVCKYVKTPGVGEVLQTGNNPIVVSLNAIAKEFPKDHTVIVGDHFADAQGKSIVIGLTGYIPNIADCPGYTPPTTTSSTTTTTTGGTTSSTTTTTSPSTSTTHSSDTSTTTKPSTSSSSTTTSSSSTTGTQTMTPSTSTGSSKSPKPSASSSTSSEAVPVSTSSPTNASPATKDLAFTGSNDAPLLWAASLLLLVGAIITLTARRFSIVRGNNKH